MSEYELISAQRPNKWNNVLRRCGRYDTYHLPGYHLVARRQGEGEPYLFVFENQGRSAALPFLRRPVAEVDGLEECGCSDAVSAYGYPGVITSATRHDPWADTFRLRFQHALCEALDQLDVVSLFVRQNPLIDSSWVFSPMTEVKTLGCTVAIDLHQPEQDQLRQYRNNHRRDIRRACREGVVVREDPGFDRIDTFRKIYVETMDHAGAAEHYYFPREYFTDLKAHLSTSAKLYFAEQGGNVVSGALFLLTGDIIQYHLGGRAARFRECRGAIKLIFDVVRAWAAQNGYRWLHLGGGSGACEDSLFNFKAGFSKLRFPFQAVGIVRRPETYRHLVQQRRQWFSHSGCEPAADDYFPAYRQTPRVRAA